MENAEATIQRRTKSCMEILNEALETECTCKTHEEWETFALETLHNNDILPLQFSKLLKVLKFNACRTSKLQKDFPAESVK